ncbi:Uncharacterized protein SCG7086_AN_00020 [Chlamydiales bacterium SCGC AG-110-P3]|nr:Uncharacterized protein SCG7086_AN_00020 [Chlamydiales bacterium SCGC AG-110-P3]
MEHDDVPMLGAAPPFSWEQYTQHIAQLFELQDFTIETGNWNWRDADVLSTGLGTPIRYIHFTLSPLDGLGVLQIADDHIDTIMRWLLKHESSVLQLPDGDYREAFFRYCTLEAIAAYQAISEDTTIAPALVSADEPLVTDALCLDITIRNGSESIAARLALSPELRKAWQQHFVTGPHSVKEQQVSETASTTVSVECGSVTMTINEWKTINAGDLLIVDRCSLTPPARGSNGEGARTLQGRVTLALEGTTIFIAEIEEDNIKIVGYPAAVQKPNQEGVEPMTDEFSEQPEEEEEEEEKDEENGEFEEFDEFDESAFEDEEEEDDEEEEEDDEEEELFAEEEASPSKEIAEDTPEAGPDTAADLSDEAAPAAPVDSPAEETEGVGSAAAAAPMAASTPEPAPRATSVTANEIPLTIKLEVARLQMNAKTLMELQPGNLLELDARPESGIDLVVNGKKVAQGELIQIGDVLGVRILEIGN